MCRALHASRWLVLSISAWASVGCADPGRTAESDLKRIGAAYHGYSARMFVGPANADDLQTYLEKTPETYASLKAGRYIVIWKVSPEELKRAAAKGGPKLADQVLGYEADVPTSGGKAVMVDGSIRTLSAAEFQEAPKAKPKK